MTTLTGVCTPAGAVIDSPEALQRVMGEKHPASAEQWAAITAPLEPVVVIAGAGSGKTTLMAARVVYLVLTGQVRPDQILGLTFTTKATAQLQAKIRQALRAAGAALEDGDGEALEPTVSTYNAYASALLAEHGLLIGHEPGIRVITDASRYQLGARALDRHQGEVAELTDHPPTAIQNLLALDSQLSEHLREPAEVRAHDDDAIAKFELAVAEEKRGKGRKTYLAKLNGATSALRRRAELLDLVETYRRLKRQLGLMDFSDQISLAARLARTHDQVGQIEREKFRVVLLDEYQDTSTAQAIMLSRLFTDAHAVMAVGDPNQAIYGWRGASVSNILGFHEHFKPPAGTTGKSYNLTINRRSGREILAVANSLARELYEATPGVQPLAADPRKGAGTVAVEVFETQPAEHAWLATRIAEMHTADEHLRWSDFAILTRDNTSAARAFEVLAAAGVPVEIVGLSGLLRLPEIAEVVALLHLLTDVTANAALLTVLTGPRWAIGPRDLKLLAQRANELAGIAAGPDHEAATVDDELGKIADGVDPAEVPALDDALADPGEADFSAEARERFGLLAQELRLLRNHASEPLLDVVRRVIDITGVDVELASSVGPAAAARRDNLDLFVKAVADFQAIDGDVSMAALLAYLDTEEQQGSGMEMATPSAVDSVKLLTVHRSKGLEFAHVFVIGVCETVFPSSRGRSLWTSVPYEMPSRLRRDAHDLPHLEGWDCAAIDAYKAAMKLHGQSEELRLGYVAYTRAEESLTVSSYLWKETTRPLGPSSYQQVVREHLISAGNEPAWLDRPDPKVTPNPLTQVVQERPWPPTERGREAELRVQAAALVVAADPFADDLGLEPDEAERVAEWDQELDRLLAEALASESDELVVPRPASLSATALSRLRDNPVEFARDLARPMPRQPSDAARFGTRFHAWIEARFEQQDLFDLDDLPGADDEEIPDDDDLAEVIAAFESGPFAHRPPTHMELPFSIVLGGQVVRGRIDAVYADSDDEWLVVDWKTNRGMNADALQLSVYRLAWAELNGLDVGQVRAGFYYVRQGKLIEPAGLLDRTELEELMRREAE